MKKKQVNKLCPLLTGIVSDDRLLKSLNVTQSGTNIYGTLSNMAHLNPMFPATQGKKNMNNLEKLSSRIKPMF